MGAEVRHEALWPPLGLLGLGVAFFVPVDRLGWFCPFHRVTGLPCVACGGTRATVAFVHGHLEEALALNPLVALGLGAFLAYCLYAGVALVVGWRFRGQGLGRYGGWIRAGIAFALSLNWAYLIAAGR